MTNEQVDRTVQYLSEQLHVALRPKGTDIALSNVDDLGFDKAALKTVLLSGLRLAGLSIHEVPLQPTGDLEPPWS